MELNKPNTPKMENLRINGNKLADYYKYYFKEYSLKDMQILVSFEQGRIYAEQQIILLRDSFYYSKDRNTKIFIEYLNNAKQEFWTYNEVKKDLSLKYDILPYLLNRLIADERRKLASQIKTDIENGLLHREPEPPKQRKKSDLQIYNEFRKNNGLKPVKSIGQKTALKNYLAQIERFKTEPHKDYKTEPKTKDSV